MSDELPMPDLPERGESLPPQRPYTGETWAKHNPEKALQAEQMWKHEGISIKKIADAIGASKNTVRAYLDSRGLLNVDPDQVKKTGQLVALQQLRHMADDPEGVPNSSRAFVAKLAMDTAQLASGAPTQIIEHRHNHTIAVPSEAEIRRFREAGKTGLEAGKMLHSGPPPLVLDVPGVPLEVPEEVRMVADDHHCVI